MDLEGFGGPLISYKPNGCFLELDLSPYFSWGSPESLSGARFFVCGTVAIDVFWLVVTGTWLLYDFPYIGNIIPTDELIFFRGVGQPPSSFCWALSHGGKRPGPRVDLGRERLRLLGSLRINPWNNSALCTTFERALRMAGRSRKREDSGRTVGDLAKLGWTMT